MNLWKISRPRFWLYLFGPYLLGVAALAHEGLNSAGLIPLIVYGIYFLFPANFLIYGINDIFDYDTDVLNTKKFGYETVLLPDDRTKTWTWILILNVPFVIAAPFLLSPYSLFGLIAFLYFGIGYSAPPIRAKTKPFLDAFFNILYVFPAVVSFGLSGLPPVTILVAGTCWCMAMHAFSAVPDISADKSAHLSTIATVLGNKMTIVTCLILYLVSAVLSFSYIGFLAVVLGCLYVGLMLASFNKTDAQLLRIYKYFPLINLLSGFLITLRILLLISLR